MIEVNDGFDWNDGMWLIANSYAWDEAKALGIRNKDRAFEYVVSRRGKIKELLEKNAYICPKHRQNH